MVSKVGRPKSRVWVLVLVDLVARVTRSRSIAGLFIGVIPFLIWGLAIAERTGKSVFEYDTNLVLLWIAAAPLLIYYAYSRLERLINNLKSKFKHERDWKVFRETELSRFHSNKHLLTGLLWAAAISYMVVLGKCSGETDAVRYWSIATYAWAALLTWVGICAAWTFLGTVQKLLRSELDVRPLHPDTQGGLAAIESFSVTAGVLYSTGFLILPSAIKVLNVVGSLPALLVWCLVLTTVVTLFAIMLIPGWMVRQVVDPRKQKAMLETQEALRNMMDSYGVHGTRQIRKLAEIMTFYQIDYVPLARMQRTPIKAMRLLEIGLGLVVPIFVAGVELIVFLKAHKII